MIITSNVSCHWYFGDGRRCFQVPYADPSKGFRPTTLRDAKKLGLVPSVTTILRALDKPALNNWRIEQAILSVLTAPRLAGEATDAFVKRVLQVDKEQDAESVKAMELGGDVHTAIEAALGDNPYNASLSAYVEPVVALVRSFGSVIATERVVVGDGYAGTMDALTDGDCVTVWDFKTTKNLPISSWPEARLQLSAYAQTIGNTGASYIKTANIYISTTEPGKVIMFEHTDWQDTYQNGFKPLLKVWRWLNNMPVIEPEPRKEEERENDLSIPMNDTNNASERMISLRQNEVMILVNHYETLAVQLEETATRYEKSVRDEFLESAGHYQSRAMELRRAGQFTPGMAKPPTPTPGTDSNSAL